MRTLGNIWLIFVMSIFPTLAKPNYFFLWISKLYDPVDIGLKHELLKSPSVNLLTWTCEKPRGQIHSFNFKIFSLSSMLGQSMNSVNVRVSLTNNMNVLMASEVEFRKAVKTCVCHVCVCSNSIMWFLQLLSIKGTWLFRNKALDSHHVGGSRFEVQCTLFCKSSHLTSLTKLTFCGRRNIPGSIMAWSLC